MLIDSEGLHIRFHDSACDVYFEHEPPTTTQPPTTTEPPTTSPPPTTTEPPPTCTTDSFPLGNGQFGSRTICTFSDGSVCTTTTNPSAKPPEPTSVRVCVDANGNPI